MSDTVTVTAAESRAEVTAGENGASAALLRPLIVASGETETVPAGETWVRSYARIDGELTIEGTLHLTETIA